MTSYIVKHRAKGQYIGRNKLFTDIIEEAKVFGTLGTITGWFSGKYGKAAKPMPYLCKDGIPEGWYKWFTEDGIDATIEIIEVKLVEVETVDFPAKALRKQFKESE